MLDNLFAEFNVRDPKRRLEAIARNYTEDVTWTDSDGTVRDVHIAVLHTLLTAQS